MSEDEYDMGDLDAESLAVVAEVEQRFQQNVNLENRAPQNAFPPKPTTALPTKPTQERFIRPPPAKRVRTNDWNASTLQNRSESDEDMLDFAVIAAGDGTYRVLNASNGIPKINLSTNSSTSQPKALTRLEQPPRPAPPRILHHPTSNSLRRAPSQSNLRPANSQHAVNASQSRIAAITAALAESDDSGDENELAKLRAQIRELQRVNDEAKASLQTKDGEISTMRRNMAKMSSSHSDSISKLQAEKNAAEERKRQAEKQMKDEMERMKTNLLIRGQELEASVRRTPWSTRKHPGLPTPARQPVVSRLTTNQTPSRPIAFPNPFPKSKGRPETVSKVNPPGPKFPGFMNSFRDNSPVKSPSKSQRVANTQSEMFHDMEAIRPPKLKLDAPQRTPAHRHRKSVNNDQFRDPFSQPAETLEESWPTLEFEVSSAVDTEEATEGAGDEDMDQSLEETVEETLEQTDHKERCRRTILSHFSGPSYHHTLQILFSVQITADKSDLSRKYTEYCSNLLDSLGSVPSDLDTMVKDAGYALIQMAEVLCQVDMLMQLSGLLNLLATVVLYTPQATASLMHSENDSLSPIAKTLTSIVRTRIVPTKETYSQEKETLVKEYLNLIEAMSITIPAGSCQQMNFLVGQYGVLSNLLDNRQPLWVTSSAIRVLAALSSHHDNHQQLLVYPDNADGIQEARPDLSRIPYVERLLSLLAENGHDILSLEVTELRRNILTFMTQIVVASPESQEILVQSRSSIPAVISCLNSCTTIIWETDEGSISKEALSNLLQVMQGSLQLLYIMVFKTDSPVDLQRKLQHPTPQFSGAEHMFVVALGRLSYADPPNFKSKTARDSIEKCADLARDLLEEVVDGPEVDTIWASYQIGEDDGDDDPIVVDDEEMEAWEAAPADEDMLFVE